MFEQTVSAVIFVDENKQAIHFYANTSALPAHAMVNFRFQGLNEEFYQKFDRALKTYIEKNPMGSLSKVSLVLPDFVFLTDAINIPTIGKKAMEHSLELAIGAIYKNKNDLIYHTASMAQNKQFATYSLVGIRKDILAKFHQIFNSYQINLSNVTFASNATVNGALNVNQKLKNATFMLLDIKEDLTRIAFVNKGRTIGKYQLPFGSSILYKSRLAAEDLLFDHASAELLVLNVKEKAKAKQLTMMGEEVLADSDADDADDFLLDKEDNLFPTDASTGKKTGRKLPKFMQRELPSDREGFVFENFRLFVKWALDLVANNPGITNLGEIDTAYVNMPDEFAFLYEMVNAESKENKLKFQPLLSGGNADDDLEAIGGFCFKQYNKNNNF